MQPHTCSPALDDLLTDFFPAVFPFPRPDIFAAWLLCESEIDRGL